MIEGTQCVGMRGVARDMTLQDTQDAQVAGALRRGEVVEHILSQMRQEVLAPRMMQAVLEGLGAALGASGTLVLDLLSKPGRDAVMHQAGADGSGLLAGLFELLQAETTNPVIDLVCGHPTLTCLSYTRFGERAGLCVWRSAGSQPWTEDDALLASSATAIMRVVLEHEAIQRELARQARTDPLTGLLNRRSFVEEVNRRIDRLDREDLPGTLMYVDLDHFKRLNDCCGHDVGDEALVQTAALLRKTVRPADVVARLGGDEFALWLDGSDELTAAERAERLRLDAPEVLAACLPPSAPALSTSIGIASRDPHMAETLEAIMRRADSAMYEVKRAGRGQWRVAPNPPRP
jgi:diguanylate cyclase (GGDEF)-like protein